MPTKERAVDRGARNGVRALTEIGREIREARAAAGLSQAVAGKAARSSQAALSRIESVNCPRVESATLSRVLAVLGLRLSMKAYPEGVPLRDARMPRSFRSCVARRRRP